MITSIISKIFGTKNQRELKKLRKIVAHINSLEPNFSSLTDAQLKAKTAHYKERVAQGESLESILPEAFAACREAGKRALNMRHFDVQLIGGIALHRGKIAEMRTGEGKTLVATLALYLNSLSGNGAHLVTVNDYLAKRDAEWMQPLYEALGVTIGIVQHDMDEGARHAAYRSDITYGTNNEFGFDYLRDNMKFNLEDYMQRDLHFAIVDEVDSILIDEARTPLIISGAAEKSSNLYQVANKAVQHLTKDVDYEVDEKARSVHMNDSGTDKVEKALNMDNLYAPENTLILHHVTQALRANALFKRDVEYVVRENEVMIVDEFTGRILPGRRYSDGLHQALEAKENVKIERENQTLAAITLQNYFRMYTKLSGMTGTAVTDAEEFHRIYKLDVLVIPTNVPIARIDEPDAIFLNKEDKFEAIIEDIIASTEKGQPVLVGTIAVETSEYIGYLLSQRGIKHEILNAKQHAREADIVEHAGEKGSITIATNMAGRGTDIKLAPGVREAGGLRIIGTERHESRRIDNQLRGRAGRQGDPGSSKFYISLEDDLIRIFSGDRLKNIMIRVGMVAGERIEHPMVSNSIAGAQERVEKHQFEGRKHILEYDDVLNQQRKVIYGYRRDILEGEEHTKQIIDEIIFDVISYFANLYTPHKNPRKEDVAQFVSALSKMTGIEEEELGKGLSHISKQSLVTHFSQLLTETYTQRRSQIERDIIMDAEKWTLLELVDQHWKIHLQVLDSLKEGINLRGYAQKNPLLEYKKESFDTFTKMMNAIKYDTVERVFRFQPEHFSRSNIESIEQEREKELAQALESGGDETSGTQPVQRSQKKVGRNDPCPCGSGKKYKQCCGKR